MILLLQSVREAQRVTMGLAAHTQPPPFGAYPIRVLGAPGCFSGKMVSENTHFQKAERPPFGGWSSRLCVLFLGTKAVTSAAQVAVKHGDVWQVFQALRIV